MTEPAKGAKGTQRASRYPKKVSERFVIAAKPGYLLPPAVEPAGDRVVDRLKGDSEVNVLRVFRSAERMGPPAPTIVVAEMPPDRAIQLAASPDLVIEPDQPLRYGVATVPVADPGLVPFSEPAEITVRVQNAEGEPVQNAEVRLLATTSSGPAFTDRSGNTTLTVAAQEVTTIAGLLVQPRDGYWNVWRPWPQLSTTDTNHIACTKIDVATSASWPRRVMGFDRLPPTYRGHGVKVAIIDSGVSIEHTDLADRVSGGHDIVMQDGKSWQQDVTGFGTAIAGLVASLAPEAELHVLKVFPGGHVSDLFEAIEHCITSQVDLIAIDIGISAPSWLIARKIEEAREYGIACVAAAGCNAGQISFPGTMPGVLTVGAVGKLGTFPADSYHATQFIGESGPDGLFPARFSGYGPQIDLCAPGVGVVVAQPPNTVGALDGTAVAVGHIAGLAALVLAHHPEFAGVREHGRLRAERLYSALRASCQPLPFSDRLKVGWGMPDAVTALGLSRSVWSPGVPLPFMMPQPVMGR